MALTFNKTRFNGVYYYESSKKLFQGKSDRCYYIRYYKNDKQEREKVGWQSEGYSPQVAAQIRIERLNVVPIINPDTTFNDAFNEFLEWAKVNKKSWQNDEQRYNLRIRPVFGNCYLKDIRSSDINDLIIQLKRYIKPDGLHYAPQTIKHYLNLIRRVFSYMKALDKFTGDNPASITKIQLERFDNSRLSYLSEDEISRLLDTCEDSKLVSPPDGAFIKFALFTGFRRSELFSLLWSNVDLDKGIIYLTETKGKRNETIILSKSALFILNTLEKTDTYVFPSCRGGKRNDIKKLWQRVKTLADVRTDIRFHDIRHTFGTMAVTAGIPLDVLQKMMTHKDIKTTQRYAHIVDKRLRDAANVIDSVFKGLNAEPIRVVDEVKSRAKKRKNESV